MASSNPPWVDRLLNENWAAIQVADVHFANIAFVNRDDPDFASDIPIIVDPGHAVFLSREYSEVPVEGVGTIGAEHEN